MATYIEINNVRYEASITGRLNDKDWDNRASKAIKLVMNYQEALNTFIDDVNWFIIQENAVQELEINEDGQETWVEKIKEEKYDNSDYSLAGDIINHRDGTITVKMGKPTAEELLAILEGVL